MILLCAKKITTLGFLLLLMACSSTGKKQAPGYANLDAEKVHENIALRYDNR